MNIVKGVIGGFIGGILGAVIWAAIAMLTGYEIGWIAWAVGGLVGFGVAVGSPEGSPMAGSVAVIIALASILAAKWITVQMVLQKEVGSADQVVAEAVSNLDQEELMISYVADDVIMDRESQGTKITWPEGVDPAEAEEESDYPPEIWTEAKQKWEGMSESEQADYRKDLATTIEEDIRAAYAEISSQGFFESFSAMDLLFFGLAVVTAYQIAAKGRSRPETPNAEESTPAT
jgi:hypothetical protein